MFSLSSMPRAERVPRRFSSRVIALVCLAFFAAAAQGAQASTIFTDEGLFIAAAAPTALESFEALTATNALDTGLISTSAFDLSHSSTPNPLLGVFNTPFAGAGLTGVDGANFVAYQSGFFQSMFLDFNVAIDAVGFRILDWGDFGTGELIFSNDAGEQAIVAVTPFPDGSSFFFGYISDFSFTHVELLNTVSGEAYGIDAVRFRNVFPVPEPASMTLLGLGVTALALRRRRAR